jgi:hypothetical protein
MSYFSTVKLIDVYGFVGHFSPSNTLKVAQPYRLVGASFENTVDANFWTAATSGAAATATVANGVAAVNAGTTSGGYAKITSVRPARFIIDEPLKFRGRVRLPSVVIANSLRAWGAVSFSAGVTPQNGMYFSVDGAGVLSVSTASATTGINTISSGSFNGKGGTTYVVDANEHTYDIIYTVGDAYFCIDGVLIHTSTATTSPLAASMNHPINFWATNTGITANAVIQCWGASIHRIGRDHTNPQIGRVTGVAATYTFKIGSGVLKGLVFGNVAGTTVTIYDNTTGAAPTVLIITTAAAAVGVWPLEIPFYTGLTIVTVGNGLDMTVIYE